MKPLTNEREVRVCVPETLPLVSVDAELIEMVIAHLIDNALKYSPQRTPISIGARENGNHVIIYVADRGVGISEEEQSRIFDKFYRGSNERHLKGTGMGLSIAREIVRAHGEELAVRSKAGEGSEFSFSLPVAAGSSGV
jgi:two-component system sensor histidine kinase KdpD